MPKKEVQDFYGFQWLIPYLNQYSSFSAKSKNIILKNKDVAPFFTDFVSDGRETNLIWRIILRQNDFFVLLYWFSTR